MPCPSLDLTTRKSHQFLALLLLFAVLFSTISPAAAQQTTPQDMEAFFDGILADQMQLYHLPGAVIVVVRDGEVFFSKGYGFSDVQARTPVDPATTLFRPGSVSKLFTWTAVMQLVEQGKLDLDQDVNAYLDFTIPPAFDTPITLRHLMTHTPGFEDRGDGLFKLRLEDVVTLDTYLKESVPARVFPPGVTGAYSNYGTALAGYIVERVSGQPFAEYVEAHIFAPLGMQQATFRQPLPESLAPYVAGGYNYTGGQYIQGEFEYVVPYPAGGLSASGLEMAKFMIAHLQDGRYGEARILEEATARQMQTQLFTHDPRLTGMAHGFFESQKNGQRVLSHGGDTLLFHSGLFLLPESGTGLFISTNGTQGYLAVESVWESFLDRYYPAGDPPALTPSDGFTERAALYTGQYYPARSSFTTFEKIMRAMNPFTVSVDGDEVVISGQGRTHRYVEVEPGLLVNTADPDDKFVLREEGGAVMLYPSVPFAMIKDSPAGNLNLHLILLITAGLLFLIAIIAWLAGLFRRGRAHTALTTAARLTAALFGAAYLFLMVVFAGQFLNILPAYGVPALYFGVENGFLQILTLLPPLLALLALALLVFSVLLWLRRAPGRFFYSLLALLALAVVWSLAYWNLLRLG